MLMIFAGFAFAFIITWWLRRSKLSPLALFLSLALVCGLSFFVFNPDTKLIGLILSSAIVLLVGIYSDLKGVPILIRIAVVFGASLLAYQLGIRIEIVKKPFTVDYLELGVFSIPLTIGWLTLFTTTFNLSNRLPGLSEGLALIASTTFLIITFLQPGISSLSPILAAAVMGMSLGALVFGVANLPINANSMLLGFVLATISIIGALKNTALLIVLLPLLVFGLPVMNTSYAILFGLKDGGSAIAIATQRRYLHDLLLAKGLTLRGTIIFFYAVNVYLCAAALLLVVIITWHFLIKLVILGCLLALGFTVFQGAIKICSKEKKIARKPSVVELFGVRISPVDMDEALQKVEEFIQSKSPHMVVTPDTPAMVKADADLEFRSILASADLVTPDGAGVVWVAKLLDLPIYERVAGVDLMERMCQLAAAKGYRVYLLGAAEGVAEEAADNLRNRYPSLEVVGSHHGYFDPDEEEGIVKEIKECSPEILFVALGVPRQEKWIKRHLDELGVPVCVGVGGSFDVLSGRFRRAPKWLQNLGLEWLYRLIHQPKRLSRTLAIPKFIFMLLKYKLLTAPWMRKMFPKH